MTIVARPGIDNGKTSTPKAPMTELGSSSGRKWSSFYDDFIPQLRGLNAVKVWREMSENDATVGSILFAVEMLIRSSGWAVTPGGETPQDEEAATFLEECKDGMAHTWEDFISAVLTMLPYGWSFFEVVYKLRQDGRVGWKKFGYRPQDSLVQWQVDEAGGVQGMVQTTSKEIRVEIPIDKALLFRTTTAKGDPNGRSILRNAYTSWFRKKRLEDYLSIGVERDLNGMPIALVPSEVILADGKEYRLYKDLVTRVKKDEQWGVIFPGDHDDNGHPLYKFDLIRGGAESSIKATHDIIRSLSNDIAGVVLADFLGLGRDAVGSRALAEPKQELFQRALQGWLDMIAATINRHAVPKLFALNQFNLEVLPEFRPEPVRDINLADLGDFIQKTAQGGMDWGFLTEGDPITDDVRQLAGFDPRPQDALGKRWNVNKSGILTPS